MLISSYFTTSNIKAGFNRLHLIYWGPNLYGEGFKLAESQDAENSRTVVLQLLS